MEKNDEAKRPLAICDYCGQGFERKNNHQRRFCTAEHGVAWHNEARDYGFEHYVTKARQLAHVG